MLRLGLVALVTLGACGSLYPKRTFVGTLDTHNEKTATLPPNASACTGRNCPSLPVGPDGSCNASGFFDIAPTGGARVTVEDGNGKVLGTGTLTKGTYQPPAVRSSRAPNQVCRFRFSIPAVPRTRSYTFSVAGHPHLATFSFGEIKERHWTIALALGG